MRLYYPRNYLLIALIPAAVALGTGCWPVAQEPQGQAPACQGGKPNGTCNELETFWSCPQDCPACSATHVVNAVNVTNPAAALGPASRSNGSATLGPNSTLIVWMGGGIWTGEDDPSPSSWDLEFKGTNSLTDVNAAFIVQILDGDDTTATYQPLGYWFNDKYSNINNKFDLKRAKIKKADSYMIRIQGQAKSMAKLDAIIVRPERCRTKPAS